MTGPNQLSHNDRADSAHNEDKRLNGHSPTVEVSTNDNADVETSEATLRQMTGAPAINRPLVSKDAFADIDISSSRPLWKLPGPKLALIALALVPIFGAAGYFLAGGSSTRQQAAIPENSGAAFDFEEANEDEAITELQKAEQEIATLKSQMALDNQAFVQDSQRSPTPQAPTGSQRNESVTEPTSATSPPESQAVNVSASSTPPTLDYSPPSPPIQSSSTSFNRLPSTEPLPDRLVEVDPFEQWRQLAQVGSYGSIAGQESENQIETNTVVASGISPNGVEEVSSVPKAYFAATSATAPVYTTIDFREESFVEQQSDDAETSSSVDTRNVQTTPESFSQAGEPEILVEAESRILSEQMTGTTDITQSLIAGGHATGELVTPVVLDNEGVEDRFMLVLSEPLMDSKSRIAIPSGALLVVQVDRVSENGLVHLSAAQAIWEEQGFQRELVLPSQTILIRGDNGDPLVAESYGDIGGDVAAMDMGQFALGAIRRVGELYTRSDSRVQTGDGTTVITESIPAPNILAGALEGGADAILDSISDRNQRAIEKLQEQPRIPYIPAGSTVQVFVNQSMQMPAGF